MPSRSLYRSPRITPDPLFSELQRDRFTPYAREWDEIGLAPPGGEGAPVLVQPYTWRYTVSRLVIIDTVPTWGSDENGPVNFPAFNLREVGNTASYVTSIDRDPATLPPDLDVGPAVGGTFGRLIRTAEGELVYLFSEDNPLTGDCAEGPPTLEVVSKTSNYTITDADTVVFADATSGPITLTLPSATGRKGTYFRIKKVDETPNPVTVASTGGVLDTEAVFVLEEQEAIAIVGDGTAWWVV